jgi:hypothetical protein
MHLPAAIMTTAAITAAAPQRRRDSGTMIATEIPARIAGNRSRS